MNSLNRPAFPGKTTVSLMAQEQARLCGQNMPNEVNFPGMSMQEYAAIHLKVPNSGTDWLDEMIKTSLRNDMAASIMAGLQANMKFDDWEWKESKFAQIAVETANTLMEKLK